METKKVTRKFYPIDEATARLAHDMMSQHDYSEGSATRSYKAQVEEAYSIVDKIAERRPDRLAHALRIADTYAKKLADNLNANNRIGTRCPSVLVAGFSNFPVHKKEKQVAALDKNMEEWQQLQGYVHQLERLLSGKEIILSDDDQVIQKLENKLAQLEKTQATMKAVNAYFRKNKTLDGCTDLTPEQIEKLKSEMARDWRSSDMPFLAWQLSNNNAEIRRVRARIKTLTEEKAQETTEIEDEGLGYTVKENTEGMRLQIFFNDVPSPDVRNLLKGKAFKWSPKNGCWQRQLTDNARYAFKELRPVMQELLERS